MLEKISGFHSRAKIDVGKKLIIFAFNFTAARRSRRARNGINKVRSLAKRVNQRGLARTRRRRTSNVNTIRETSSQRYTRCVVVYVTQYMAAICGVRHWALCQ